MLAGVAVVLPHLNPHERAREVNQRQETIWADTSSDKTVAWGLKHTRYARVSQLDKNDRAVSWGLRHHGSERVPTPPDGAAELLKEFGGMFVKGRASSVGEDKQCAPTKEVFLTFDLGYEAGYTGQVLDILKKHKIRAIFFLCGNYLKETELVNRMIDDGHKIGNHTDHHKDLPRLGDDAIRKDITDFDTKFKEKFGDKNHTIKHFRPPKGRLCERSLSIAKDEGLTTLMWSGAIVDWHKTPINAQKSSDKIISRIHPGAILLFHIANSGMPKMLDIMIPSLIEKGYTIGNAGEL